MTRRPRASAGPGAAVTDAPEVPGAPRPEDGADPAPSPWSIPEFRALLPIGLTVAIGFSLVIPVLPAFARSFGVGLAVVGLVTFVFGFTRFSFGIVGGLVVDRFGERAATVTGILVVSASSYASGFAQNFWQLVVARGFGGAGSALFIGGLMNRILKIVPPQAMGRATGIWRSSFVVGAGIGFVIGGTLRDQLGFRWPLHIYATGLLVSATLAWFSMRSHIEGPSAERRSPIAALRAARPVLKDPRYVVALLATLVAWWTLSGPAGQIATIYAEEQLGYSGTAIGIAGGLLSVGEILVVLFVAGPAADRLGRRAVLAPALALTAVATAALGFIDGAAILYFPLMMLIGAGMAAGSAASGGLLADSIPAGGSGAAVGVNQMAGDLGYMLAPSVIGAVADGPGYAAAYTLGAVPAALVFFATLRLPREQSGHTEHAGHETSPAPEAAQQAG